MHSYNNFALDGAVPTKTTARAATDGYDASAESIGNPRDFEALPEHKLLSPQPRPWKDRLKHTVRRLLGPLRAAMLSRHTTRESRVPEVMDIEVPVAGAHPAYLKAKAPAAVAAAPTKLPSVPARTTSNCSATPITSPIRYFESRDKWRLYAAANGLPQRAIRDAGKEAPARCRWYI